MKLKIKSPIPVKNPPPVGTILEVVSKKTFKYGGDIFTVSYKGNEIGIFPNECEIIKEANDE
jgi:hypothetical protein